jgi:hypothetical protein
MPVSNVVKPHMLRRLSCAAPALSSAGLLLRGDIAARQGDRQQARRDYEEAVEVLQGGRDTDSTTMRRGPRAVAARIAAVQARIGNLDR